MSAKGLETREAILQHSVRRAIDIGLEGLSIGLLAKELGMSKSGVFAHFKSKEGLQLALIDHVADVFLQQTIRPALRAPRGRARLQALADSWLAWLLDNEFGGGCFFVAASVEYQGRPGPIRQRLVAHQRDWLELIENVARTAVAEGSLAEDTDLERFAYEFHAAGLIQQHASRLLDDPRAAEIARAAFERLINPSTQLQAS
jgi:AcrR family transcriptional regulator